MRAQCVLTVGFMAVMVLTGVVNASESFADARRVDVIGSLQETVAQTDGMKSQGDRVRVDVIERVGSEGVVYPYTKPMSR